MSQYLNILLPPLAVLNTGKVGAFTLNLLLTSLFWVPGVIHAILITKKYYGSIKYKELVKIQEQLYKHNQLKNT